MPVRGRGRPRKEPHGVVETKDSEGEMEENRDSGEVKGTEEEGEEPTLSDLMAILQTHMGQQNVREVKQQQQFAALEHKFQLLQLEVSSKNTDPLSSREPGSESCQADFSDAQAKAEHMSSSQTLTGQSHTCHEPRMEKLTDNDDMEHFLITFERIALACRWPKSDWVFHLIPLLTGKARGAYVHMDFENSLDYIQVKSAILSKYNISSETYRQRFRSLEIHAGESPKELYARLKELYVKWIEPKSKTIHDIGEVIILEQYLRMLSPELQVWIKERDPKTALKAAELADVFVAAREQGQTSSREEWKMTWDYDSAPQRHLGAEGVSKPQNVENQSRRPQKYSGRKPICFLCGIEGHIKPMCPKNTAKMTQMCYAPWSQTELSVNNLQTVKMAGFYHRFIPQFSARAATLTDLTGSRNPNHIQWTKEAVAAFQDIRQSLSKNPVLYSPNFNDLFIVQTDASERGLGAVLLQGPQHDRHPLAYISRKLFPREVRYSTVEKEALAIKWALDSFRYYLLGPFLFLHSTHPRKG
ncbi:uncharacterized protein LOC114465064 [Gouania willdenowi]|uniref:uncharacterized protein LOC114465064 n=1 Tax=Gouania willdenowi TaxID=441366 RepID=UPI0010543CCB|nr:uncharacterized protein LOC114465064 [Gouania willdenowi]